MPASEVLNFDTDGYRGSHHSLIPAYYVNCRTRRCLGLYTAGSGHERRRRRVAERPRQSARIDREQVQNMTERIESIEMYPMRGHSRGDWYGTLEDIANSEENAEYWALFGVTHRGNKHCLGEFPTKSAAASAASGMRLNPLAEKAPPRPDPSSHERIIVQIEVVADQSDPSMIDLFALCADGTVWRRGVGIHSNASLAEDRWEPISLDGMADDPEVRSLGTYVVSLSQRPDS